MWKVTVDGPGMKDIYIDLSVITSLIYIFAVTPKKDKKRRKSTDVGVSSTKISTL